MAMTKAELKQAIKEGLQCNHCDKAAVDIHRLDPEQGYIEGNMMPLCKECHMAIHNNEARLTDLRLRVRFYYDVQENRKRIANQVRAYNSLGEPLPSEAQMIIDVSKKMEEKLKRPIEALLRHEPIYNAWLKHIKGIGPMLGASLIAEIGDIGKFRHVRSLWHYAGLHVVDGSAPKRRRGQKSTWNGRLRTTAWKCASQFVRSSGSFGRQLYLDDKAFYIAQNGDLSKGHIDNRARRRVAKDLLRCLWAKWRELEGLPVTEARIGTWPMPEDWVSDQAKVQVKSQIRTGPSLALSLFEAEGDSR